MPRGNVKDCGSGLLFMLIGAGFGLSAWFNLRIGTAIDMGPGYFPLLLGAILALFGLLILLRGLRASGEPIGPVSLRAVLAICLAIVLFAVLVYPVGFLPSTFLAVWIATLAAPGSSPVFSLGLSAGLTAFCCAVFIWGLGLPLPLLPGWTN